MSVNQGNYVTIVKDCLICKREVILLDRRFRDIQKRFPKDSQIINICEDCEKKWLIEKDGIALIHQDTGSVVVITKEAFERIFDVPPPEGRIAYTEMEVLKMLNPEEFAEKG